jgi:CPA2 family monovalent cation:H+ antiporter-2
MIELGSLMFEIGIIMLVAFIGAMLLSKLGLSLIIAYILIGMVIGPNISFQIGGFSYEGVIQDTALVNQLASIGLILLLFFVGLGFSARKLKKTKGPAAIIAMLNLGINMFVGIAIGTLLGWPLIDTIFLAGVISMSSSAVTAKSLIDLKKLSSEDTEYLLGVVIVESFAAMFLLTVIHGLVVRTEGPNSIIMLVVGVVTFLAFFAFLAAWLIPRVVKYIERIENEEIFILFALGTVFLAAALAEILFIPAIIGAFFIGMVFADTRLSERMATKMAPMRDVFVAIFFISFGMMINPSMFPSVFGILLMAVPLIILNDILITASLAYFVGFSSKGAVFLGSSLIGRNEESVFYSAIGTNAINNNPTISHDYGGRFLNPFAGLLCIVMSSLTPSFMKRSDRLTRFFSRILPQYMKFGGKLVAKTVKSMVMPSYLPLYRRNRKIVYALVAYVIFVIALIASGSILHIILSILIIPVGYYMWKLFQDVFEHPIRNIRVSENLMMPSYRKHIENFVLGVIVGGLVSIALVPALWPYWWILSLIVLMGYLTFVVVSMKNIYLKLTGWEEPKTVPERKGATTNGFGPFKRE